jgi:hypothetical protein
MSWSAIVFLLLPKLPSNAIAGHIQGDKKP